MDIDLARTFIAIVETGSFVRAAERLHVTQTAVSARVKSLEDQLRRQLFLRNKAGAALTPAGEQFLRFAPTLIQVWERAKHQVALPEGRRAVLALGGELSLWNPLLLNWMVTMRRRFPDVALRTQVGLPEGLLHQVSDGLLDVAVVYAPRQWPGLKIEMLYKEKLVLVTTNPLMREISNPEYVYVDWGPEFAAHHRMSFPGFADPGMFVGLGPLGLDYILKVGGSGYFRLRAVERFVASGRLHLVPDASEFLYPVYAVCSAQCDEELMATAMGTPREACASQGLDATDQHLAPDSPVPASERKDAEVTI